MLHVVVLSAVIDRRYKLLEIDSGVDRDGPRSRNSWIHRMLRDPTETGGVDVGVRIVPYRPVQHINSVGTDREHRSLSNPDPFLQRHIESEPGGPFNAGQTQSKIPSCSRFWILKNDIPRAIDNDVVAESSRHRRTAAKVRRRCP